MIEVLQLISSGSPQIPTVLAAREGRVFAGDALCATSRNLCLVDVMEALMEEWRS